MGNEALPCLAGKVPGFHLLGFHPCSGYGGDGVQSDIWEMMRPDHSLFLKKYMEEKNRNFHKSVSEK